MKQATAWIVALCVLGLVTPGQGREQKQRRGQGQKGAPSPKPRRNAKKGDFAVFPLGGIGGRGEVLAGESTIKVLGVAKDGPGAVAGLRVGDVVVTIAGEKAPRHSRDINVGGRGPMELLGRAVAKSEASASGRLGLVVRRGDATLELSVVLPRRGSFSASYPTNCKTSLRFYDGICRQLLRSRRKDGLWRSRTGEDATRYVSALCGLALLGRGQRRHLPALERVAKRLAGPKRRGYVSDDFSKPAGLSNWFICASGIYLAEFVLATGDTSYLPTLQHLCDCMVARQTDNGKYGHGLTAGYKGRGFNAINTHAHLLWALAERAGCKIDGAAWTRSLAEIRKSTGKNGGVRYWTAQTGYWDAAARTGQMALALDLRDQAPELAARMAGYLDKHHLRMREAHAMGSIGMIFGTAALRRLRPDAWRRHMDSWRWYLSLMRKPNESAAYIGGKRNNGGDHYLRQAHVAQAIAGLMLASGLGKLHLCGNEAKSWLKSRAR